MAGALAGRRSWPPELLVVGFWAVVACLPFHAAYVIDLAHVLRPPSWQHWFGTDQLGRDVLARTLAGAGPILAVAPAATALAVLAGGALGLVGGYYGGATDAILAAPLEAVLALPLIVVAVMALAAVGPSAGATIAVIAFVFTPLVARTVRAATLAERRREYVALAQLRGESTAFILAREILPNVVRPLLVEAVVRLGYAIFTAASLGFLGFGRSPPSPDWGLTIADTYGLMAGGAWWPTLWPALATASLVLAVQGLAERWQPAAVGLRRAARAGVADGAPAPDGALVVDDLTVAYGAAVALRRVSLRIAPGEILGVVGESGCGKSTLGLAALGALPAGACIAGAVTVAGTALDGLTPGGLRRLWARRVSYVPQDPVRALNPAMRVGTQMGEVLRLLGVPRRERPPMAAAALTRLGIAETAAVLRRYPGEISGGMAQRVTLAMALAKRPALLVLDEPTTGLDRENAAAALDMARRLSREAGAALLLISHDLDMVARVSDRIAVLYAGSLVEAGPADAVLARPRHPYTALLLGCRPRLAARGGVLPTIPGRLPDPAALPAGCGFAARCPRAEPACAAGPVPWAGEAHGAECLHPDMPVPAAGSAPETARPVGAPVLEAAALACTRQGRRVLHDVSLAVGAAETVGVTGPSGSGKTTLARAVLGLAPADRGGRLRLRGEPLALALAARGPAQKRAMQAVFQNPDAALNPALPVRHMLERPLRRLAGLRGAALEARVAALAEALRLDPALLERRPGALSGGQKQRVAIAHAFAAEPAVVVCDEPTSALDLSVQAAVLNAIVAQRARTGTALLLISHDADVLAFMADRLVRLGEANSLKH